MRLLRQVLYLALGCMAGPALAQTVNGEAQAVMPTPDAVAREMQRIAGERQALFGSASPSTSSAGTTGTTGAPVPSLPTLPAPLHGAAGVDLAAMAQRFEGTYPATKRDALLIFASFAMPTASLQRILADAAKVGATVVLRGFKNNSLKETSAALKALGNANGAVQIHPQAFSTYRITAVPAVVLLHAKRSDTLDAEGCALPEDFVALAGDVSLDYALESIARQAPDYAAIATRYRQPLRGRE